MRDALGQISTMSLDNQRNLKLAIHRDPLFMKVAETVAVEMDQWNKQFSGKTIINGLGQAAGFHHQKYSAPVAGILDDRHVRLANGQDFPPQSSTPSSSSSIIIRLWAMPEVPLFSIFRKFRQPKRRPFGMRSCPDSS